MLGRERRPRSDWPRRPHPERIGSGTASTAYNSRSYRRGASPRGCGSNTSGSREQDTGVAEPLGDHRDGDAGGEHGGGHEVPRSCSRNAGEPGAAPVGDEALGDPVGLPRTPAAGSALNTKPSTEPPSRVALDRGGRAAVRRSRDRARRGRCAGSWSVAAPARSVPQPEPGEKPTAAWSKSTSDQRMARSWLRRAPVITASCR